MTLVALSCSDDVRVCRVCIGWMREKAGMLHVTPTLPVVDMDQSLTFYEAAGFEVQVYEGGGFAFVHHDGESVFDLGLESDMNPEVNKAGCYVIVPAPDEWHAVFSALEYPVTELRNEDYGMREFTLTDPSGNHLRFGHAI
jgi:catechol 2,3-dioxygenase-like lactoylglutathione lyase family enzyme